MFHGIMTGSDHMTWSEFVAKHGESLQACYRRSTQYKQTLRHSEDSQSTSLVFLSRLKPELISFRKEK